MAFGVTEAGFVRMRLPEVRQAIVDALRANLRARNLPDNIETRPDSVAGALIDTFADREAALWEHAEAQYYAMYPGSATRVSLDRAVSYSGASRQGQERSGSYVIVYGEDGTIIEPGSQIRNRTSQNLWHIVNETTIGFGAAAAVRLIPTVESNVSYTVTVDGTAYTYVSPANATLSNVLAGMVSVLSASALNVSSTGTALQLLSANQANHAITPSARFTVAELGTSTLAQSDDFISELAGIGDLNSIVTVVGGWTGVNNVFPGTAGRTAETDAELRTRYQSGVFRLGAATLPTIAPNVRDAVPGLAAIRVFNNRSDEVDEFGRLPHSVHVIARGGLDEDIARAIYKFIAGGIDTNGAVVNTIATTEGEQTIRFDRPQNVYVFVRAVLTLRPASEASFPSDGFASIRANLAAKGSTLGIGDDVIRQSLFCAIYDVPGVASAVLSLAHSTNPAFVPTNADYTETNISISPIQQALFDVSRVEVT